jgi:hypothetical protein
MRTRTKPKGPPQTKGAPAAGREASQGENGASARVRGERPSLEYVDILSLGDRFIAAVGAYGRKYNLVEWLAAAPVLGEIQHRLESAPAIPGPVAREIGTMPTAARELEARHQAHSIAGKKGSPAAHGEEMKCRVLEERDRLKRPGRDSAAKIAKLLGISARQVRTYLKRK